MKKNIFLSLIMAVILLAAGCATFPVKSEPGLYVNDWPVFSLSYPADWVEKTPNPQEMFRVQSAEGTPELRISVFPSMGMPLNFCTRMYVPELAKIGKDIKVIYEKESKLNDGTPAYESEIEWTVNIGNGIKLDSFLLTTQKENLWILVGISVAEGKIEEKHKQIAYSLKMKGGEDKLVKVPDDIQEFLDQYSRDIVSHDLERVMSHFSDQYRHNGASKSDVENFYKMIIYGIASFEPKITKFVSQENNAYLAGYLIVGGNMKFPLISTLAKENDKWKFYGNQKQREL